MKKNTDLKTDTTNYTEALTDPRYRYLTYIMMTGVLLVAMNGC
jgi:hypothetical protein